jgi:regulator of RNase E activity RraA
VGDGDGVIVVPLELADEVAEEAAGMEAFETYVLEKVNAGAAVIGLYPPNEKAREEYQTYLRSQENR